MRCAFHHLGQLRQFDNTLCDAAFCCRQRGLQGGGFTSGSRARDLSLSQLRGQSVQLGGSVGLGNMRGGLQRDLRLLQIKDAGLKVSGLAGAQVIGLVHLGKPVATAFHLCLC